VIAIASSDRVIKSLRGRSPLIPSLQPLFQPPCIDCCCLTCLTAEEDLSRAETTGLLAQKVATMLKVKPHLQEDALVTHLNNKQCPNLIWQSTPEIFCPQKLLILVAIAMFETINLLFYFC
jgi:hypothetical protein